MPIRNSAEIIGIISDTETAIIHPYLEFEPYFSDHEYWSINFSLGIHLTNVDRLIPAEILEEIRTGDLYLKLTNPSEAIPENVPYIYDLLERLNIPESKVTFVTGAYDIESTIIKIATDRNKQPIKCVIVDFFLLLETIRIFLKSIDRIEKPVPTKRFICANRHWKLHRPILIAMLTIKDLMQYGYVSLRKANDNLGWDSCFHEMSKKFPCLENHKETIMSIPDLYIDHADFNVGHPDEMDRKWHDQCYFSIINETTYYENTRFITEKTYKNINYEMPFILVSRPHSLSLLREKGFKTFSPYINEDYDLEEDDNKRMLMIVNEIERLCKLSEEEILELVNQLRPICEYNRQVLINKKYPDDFIWHAL